MDNPRGEKIQEETQAATQKKEQRRFVDELQEMKNNLQKTGKIDIELTRPILSGRENIKTLKLDFNKITSRDLIDAEQRCASDFGMMGMQASQSVAYKLIIAAKAGGVLFEDLISDATGLHFKDSYAVGNIVTSFLVG